MGECSKGWLKNRLIFTVHHQAKLIYYVAREMADKGFKPELMSGKKILNLPSRKWGTTGSKKVLLNMDRAGTVNKGRVVCVEGPTSAAVMGAVAVASLGKSLS